MPEPHTDDLLIQAVLASGVRIPPLPDALIRLNAALADPDAGPRELAAAIQQDGASCGALFRLVASPVYGLRRKVESVEKAAAVLGMRAASTAVRGAALHAAMQDPAQAHILERLWTRSGAIAETMVAALRLRPQPGINADQAYTLGMFHDCGVGLLLKRFPAYALGLESPAWPDLLALDQAVGSHHAVVGQMVAKHWLLPEDIAQAIRHHHDLAPGNLSDTAARLVAVLQFILHMQQRREEGDDQEWRQGWDQECARRLGLTAEQLTDWGADLSDADKALA